VFDIGYEVNCNSNDHVEDETILSN
jgi:hypothetical protein